MRTTEDDDYDYDCCVEKQRKRVEKDYRFEVNCDPNTTGGQRRQHSDHNCIEVLCRFGNRLDIQNGNEWQQICETLLSCEELLTRMGRSDGILTSNERPKNEINTTTDNNNTTTVAIDDRQQLRQVIAQIEPKKYRKREQELCRLLSSSEDKKIVSSSSSSSPLLFVFEPKNYYSKYCDNNRRRESSSGRRSSYHRLKALTQLLMTSNLKRSTSLQSIPKQSTDDDTTATLPRLRRRPRITRYYHSLDISTDNDCNESEATSRRLEKTKADRSGLSLVLTSSPSVSQLLPTRERGEEREQLKKQLNRHSCDVTSLVSHSSQNRDNVCQMTPNNRQILKYSKKRLRGPYGEMLESMMNTRNSCAREEESAREDMKQNLSFIQELLKETERQRNVLDGNAKETTGTATGETTGTTVVETTTQQTTSNSETTSPSITATIGRHLDTRTHIVGELYDTEKSFCEQLKDLLEKYWKPLNELLIIDCKSLEIIFGKIPHILQIHSKFLEELRHRIKNWSPLETTVGDLFELFEEKTCFDAYLSFVDNWFESKQLIKQLSREKPNFQKFLHEQSHSHRSKLSLDELMIAIIQRIPRFELLLKQLVKNTAEEHKDSELLSSALKKIHSLVLYINRVKNDVEVSSQSSSLSSTATTTTTIGQQLELKDLESICDGFPTHLVLNSCLQSVFSVLIRKRERIVLLFDNLLVIVSIKGKKKSEKFEENKYKVLNHFHLNSLEISSTRVGGGGQQWEGVEGEEREQHETSSLEVLERDLQILQTIQTSFLCRLSSHSRHVLETVFSELNQNLNKRMNEMKNEEKNLELVVNSNTPLHSQNQCNQSQSESAEPQTTGTTTTTNTICVTFLSQEKREKFEEMFRELKKFKTNSKLLPKFLCFLPIRKTRAGLQFTCASPTIGTNDVWICNSDGFVGQISVLSLNWTSLATIEPTVVSCNGVCNSRIICMTCVPKSEQNSSQTQTSDEEMDNTSVSDSETQSDSNTTTQRQHTDSLSSSSRSSLCSPTMWFGTEDSSVHIYSCFDAIRIKKNKVKVTLSAKVEAITHFNDRVFVSLANQSVAIFDTDPLTGSWQTTPSIREHVNCFRTCSVQNGLHLWTSGHNNLTISIRDSNLEQIFDDITVDDIHTTTADDHISQMVAIDANDRVFVSTQNSLSIHLFSSLEPFSHLSNISIQTTLHRALISCEDIIRQHKSACLRISSLLGIKESVWIGTSAGIICVLDSKQLELQIVPNGHTGHVRFLTSIETNEDLESDSKTARDLKTTRTLVISGGDGIELYRRGVSSGGGTQGTGVQRGGQTSGQNVQTSGREVVVSSGQSGGREMGAENGREDSTNHLLLWQISD